MKSLLLIVACFALLAGFSVKISGEQKSTDSAVSDARIRQIIDNIYYLRAFKIRIQQICNLVYELVSNSRILY